MTFPTPKTKYRNSKEVQQGFTPKDTYLLKKYDNPTQNPQIQVLGVYMEDEEEEEEEEQQTNDSIKYCPSCDNFTLKLMPKIDKWFCTYCTLQQETDPPNPPKPADKNDVFISSSLGSYPPVMNEHDPSIPYLASIDPNKQRGEFNLMDLENVESVRETAGGRIKHIRVRDGIPPEVLSAQLEQELNQ